MINLTSFKASRQTPEIKPLGFDDYQISLGDMMRGERATLGKSLMDVQRELKIKAAYIAAVEDADPSVFDTPGFIAGYVRSYAKYLGMDPEKAFNKFCAESGFAPIHGMSEKALPIRMSRDDRLAANGARAAGALGASTTFMPPKENFLARLDLKALVSSLVLICLVGGLGYGAYNVVQEIQQVRMVPIDQAPLVDSDLDPLAPRSINGDALAELSTPEADALNQLYRPQVLESPILVPRDGPIANLNPSEQGAFAVPRVATTAVPLEQQLLGQPAEIADAPVVVEGPETVTLVATAGVWLRVRDAQNAIILEKILDAGESYDVPLSDEAAVIERAGNSGALFFAIGGEVFGPAGNAGSLAKGIDLSPEVIRDTYAVYEASEDLTLLTFLGDIEAVDDSQ